MYVSVLCDFYCVMAVGTLFDQVGKSLTTLNPTIPKDVRDECEMNAVKHH